jgi:NAD+ synthase (glutamine-hydrolysing)
MLWLNTLTVAGRLFQTILFIRHRVLSLRPDQKDADSLPEYDVLDKVLYQYIERRQGPNEIKAQGVEPALVDRIFETCQY